jgi:hypothetical protein
MTGGPGAFEGGAVYYYYYFFYFFFPSISLGWLGWAASAHGILHGAKSVVGARERRKCKG